jgi:hypothetical protein
MIISQIRSRIKDYNCLEVVLNDSIVTKRGSVQSGVSENCVALGAHARRGGTGVSMKHTKSHLTKEKNYLQSVTERMETPAKTIMPSSIIKGLSPARQSVNTSTESMTNKNDSIWPSVAISSNYISPAHIDEGFLLILPYYNNREKY